MALLSLGPSSWHRSLAFSLLKTRTFLNPQNPEMTFLCLYRALVFLHFFLQQNPSARILFLGTNPEFKKIVESAARVTNQDCVFSHWVGGGLTNWPQIVQSIRTYHYFESHFINRLKKSQKRKCRVPWLDKLKKAFEGYKDLEGTKKSIVNAKGEMLQNQQIKRQKSLTRPHLLIILNPEQNTPALLEAKTLQIPVLALVNSDTAGDKINYPIPGNNQRQEFIYFCLNWMTKIILNSSNLNKNPMTKMGTQSPFNP